VKLRILSAFLSLAILSAPSPAIADVVIVEEKDLKFPRCSIEIDSAFGSAKVERTMYEGLYFHQFIFWEAARKQLKAPFDLNLYWRKARSSGMSNGPILDIEMHKDSSGKARSFRKGSNILVLPQVKVDGGVQSINYGPLNHDKAKYRISFEIDAVEIMQKLADQEHVLLRIEEWEGKATGEVKLSMNFVRAFVQVSDSANEILDKWQTNGGWDCPGVR